MEEKQTDSISPGTDTYISSIQKMEVRQSMLSFCFAIYLSYCCDQINHSRFIFSSVSVYVHVCIQACGGHRPMSDGFRYSLFFETGSLAETGAH